MARKERRISDETAAVLKLFMADPDREWFGLDIVREAKIQSGSLYPILHRLEGRDVLTSAWEPQSEAIEHKRRPRCLYRLDPRGGEQARLMLQEWEEANVEDSPAVKAPRKGRAWAPSPS